MNSYSKIYKCIDENDHVTYTDVDCNIRDTTNIVNKTLPTPVLAKPIVKPTIKSMPNQEMVSTTQVALNSHPEESIPQQSPKNTSFFSRLFENVSNFFSSSFDNNADITNTVDTDVSKNQKIYQCDGRTKCPQMTSCEEATFFINHCPDTKMDGDHDGIPCEQQWCD